jgi:hypothetical protein
VALAVASLLLAGCTATGAGAGSPTPTATGAPRTDVLELAVGDCTATGGATRVTATVPVVDCDEPHDGEAYALITLDDAEFPGAEAVTDRAVEECTAEFAAFIGIDYAASKLDFAYYYPTPTSWERGDRDILCIAFDPASATVTGTLKGAAR